MGLIEPLLDIMRRLRDPDGGCPWDREQDFRSLLPYTLEEVYEVVDAIERDDYSHLREELGDLLFQVVFYAQIADEQGLFGMDAVIGGIAAKLRQRHPHVFAEDAAHLPTSREALHRQWEARKQEDRTARGAHGLLADIPVALPALQRAGKIQSRLARIGFDWESPGEVLAQLRAEMAELEEAIARGHQDDCLDELGDVLFSCVNLARHLGLDAETGLRRANDKVSRRIAWMESEQARQGDSLHEKSLPELEALWIRAKRALAERGRP